MLTQQLFEFLKEATAGDEAAAPNFLSEQAYEMFYDCGEEFADKLSDLVFELTSMLVDEPPKYK